MNLNKNTFIVGSVRPNGAVSFSEIPKVHYSEREARTECERLALTNRQKTFIYVQVKGICSVPSVMWS